ncbi:MAG TPA: GAF domain-containing protein [Pseudogracilibacillus sp.]|nr:GAF domain-containing protein [Pseudogracilibacillus sp.]
MFETIQYSGSREKDYELVIKQLDILLEGESNQIANLSNAAALLNHFLNDINWVGFYLTDENKQANNELVLGPFQGLPACIRIPFGKGVCGTAAETRLTQVVPNVHEFPGHIACDSASNSEIVIPLVINNDVYGVLDIDSPSLDRFDDVDKQYLEKFCNILIKHLQ